jgi:hypothetical protein
MHQWSSKHIAGAAVETHHRGVAPQHADVGHAADVQHRHCFARSREPCRMEGRYQGCTLSAGGHVAAAQVAHHIDAAEFGQQRAVEQLQRVSGAVELTGAVAHGLAMRAHCPHLIGRQCGGRQQPGNGQGVGM